MGDKEAIDKLKSSYEQFFNEIRKVIIGQDQVVEQVLVSIFSRGHCLLVGVPGLAKTLLVTTISRILGLDFKRPAKIFNFQLGLTPYVEPLFGVNDAKNHRGVVAGGLLDFQFRFGKN